MPNDTEPVDAPCVPDQIVNLSKKIDQSVETVKATLSGLLDVSHEIRLLALRAKVRVGEES